MLRTTYFEGTIKQSKDTILHTCAIVLIQEIPLVIPELSALWVFQSIKMMDNDVNVLIYILIHQRHEKPSIFSLFVS